MTTQNTLLLTLVPLLLGAAAACSGTGADSPSTVGSVTSAMQDDKCKDKDDDHKDKDKKHDCPDVPTIHCTTRIENYFTGVLLRSYDEPDVPVVQGATARDLWLVSAGIRDVTGNDLRLVQDPRLAQFFYGIIPYGGGFPMPGTNVTLTVAGDQATLTAFSHRGRRSQTEATAIDCTAGTTTIQPAPTP